MPTSTEVAIATTTLSSAASTITFSSIPATYTDLRLVLNMAPTVGLPPEFRLNGSASGYSQTTLYGTGSAAGSSRETNVTIGWYGLRRTGVATYPALFTVDIFSYAGNTNKTGLITGNNDRNGAGSVEYHVALWRDTSAVNSITMRIDNGAASYAAGTTATLYGIL